MKKIFEEQYRQLCRNALQESETIWRANPHLTRADALWLEIFSRLSRFLEKEINVFPVEGAPTPGDEYRWNITRVIENRKNGDFDSLRIASEYIREALLNVE